MQFLQKTSGLPMLLVLGTLSVLSAMPVQAGGWTGPTYKVTGRFPVANPEPNTPKGGGFNVGLTNGPRASGTVETTFTWVRDDDPATDDAPPPTLKVLETATAGWHGPDGEAPPPPREIDALTASPDSSEELMMETLDAAATGSCSNGLGDSCVATADGNGGISTGHRLRERNVVGDKVVVPAVSLSATVDDPDGATSWEYKAGIAPPVNWVPEPAIENSTHNAPRLLLPQGNATVYVGEPLTCEVEKAKDEDTWTAPGNETGTSPENVTYTWTSPGGGGFLSPNSPRTTWTAPQTAGTYTLTCKIDDPWADGQTPHVKGITDPDTGDRNDTAVIVTLTVTVLPVAAYSPTNPGPNDPEPSHYNGVIKIFSGPPTGDLPVSPGETVSFSGYFVDWDYRKATADAPWEPIAGTGPYQVVFSLSSNQAEFINERGEVVAAPTFQELQFGVVYVRIKPTWDRTTITVRAVLTDNAGPPPNPATGSTRDNPFTAAWRLIARPAPPPTGMYQKIPGPPYAQWVTVPDVAKYTYQMTGHAPNEAPPDPANPTGFDPVPLNRYEGQTVHESFGDPIPSGFTLADLTLAWKNANANIDFTAPDALNEAALRIFTKGANGSFRIDASSRIEDKHTGSGLLQPNAFEYDALRDADGISFILDQTYSCDNRVVGTYQIQRNIKYSEYGGEGYRVRKSGP